MPNRRERRAAQFGKKPPPIPKKEKKLAAKAIGSGDITLWCLAGAMEIVLQFLPYRERLWVLIASVAIALLLVHPMAHLPWVVNAESLFKKTARTIAAFTLMLGAVSLFGWYSWPPLHRHILSRQERGLFETPLKGKQSPEMSIQLACAPNDEVDCEYAAGLIPLFGEAGWKVVGTVDRVQLGRPMPGITLGLKGGKKDDVARWDAGGWVAMTPTLEHVKQAFENIGIEVDSTTGPDLPDGQISIYVGHEKPNESEPTDLTRSYERIYRMQKDGTYPGPKASK